MVLCLSMEITFLFVVKVEKAMVEGHRRMGGKDYMKANAAALKKR